MGKIYGAINRINDPFIFGILFDLTDFFTSIYNDREIFFDHFYDRFFRCMICFRYQIVDAFFIAKS